MELEIRQPKDEQEFERYYDLRWRVLRRPWTQPKESEKDEHESGALHLTAWLGEKLVGVGRLHFKSTQEAQIRFMAVEEGYTDQGIGGAIVEALEANARTHRAHLVVLNARDRAVKFYERHGYQRVTSEAERLFDSITQWRMSKQL